MRSARALVALMLAMCGVAFAAARAPVTVTILPTGPQVWRVSVLFPTVVEKQVARAAGVELASRAGWTASSPTYSVTPARGRFPAQCSVEFTVGTLFPNGEFPVEAFAVVFRRWHDVDVMFAHGGAFQYQGQPHYEDDSSSIDAKAGPTSFTLLIHIKDPTLTHLTALPPMQRSGAPARSPQTNPLLTWAAVAVGVAAAAWVLAYVMVHRAKKRR